MPKQFSQTYGNGSEFPVICEDSRRWKDREKTVGEALQEMQYLGRLRDRKGCPVWKVSGSLQAGCVIVTHRHKRHRIVYYTRAWLENLGL
ncbi:hypothetical protein [Thalassobacillus pellis]|uniref:hypothetical protein n=1 Tax=Thalassobacillus pellis TaxID=748008 RepID=UPI00195FBE92|nr:hypothetical protein [Thalassobacillus pellis]MBM7554554.1 hypothetical protein [Thalassobacillus pellis]